jgi:hypothetical protein
MERQPGNGDDHNLLPAQKIELAHAAKRELMMQASQQGHRVETRDGIDIMSEVRINPEVFALAFELDPQIEEALEAELSLAFVPQPNGGHYRVTLFYTSTVTYVGEQFKKHESWDLYEDPNIPGEATVEYLAGDEPVTHDASHNRSLTVADQRHLQTLLAALHG